MEDRDIRIAQYLMADSRMPYSVLARRVGLSTPRLRRRIHALTTSRVIKTFTTMVSLEYLGASPVILFGRSECDSLPEAAEALGKSDLTFAVYGATGNVLYVSCVLREASELSGYVDFATEVAQLKDVLIGLRAAVPGRRAEARGTRMSLLDYRIVSAMHLDARKPASRVAAELGVSTKTVRRRLGRMARNGCVDFTIEWAPHASGDLGCFLHVYLKRDADSRALAETLLRKLGSTVMFYRRYANLPDFLLLSSWTRSVGDLQDVVERIRGEAGVRSVVPNLLYSYHRFENWWDRYQDTMIADLRETRRAELSRRTPRKRLEPLRA